LKVQNDIFYSLNIEDNQTVAIQEIGRELVDEEVEKKIKDLICERINWYDAILDSIPERVEN
jgi:hypothetical protein